MESKTIKIAATEREKRDALAVRRTVFVLEQNVPPELETDENDKRPETVHLVAYDRERRPIAAARLRPWDGATGKVERVAVLENWRGKGLGREIMLALEKEARTRGFTQLKLNAQSHAQAFYEKLGYRPVGDRFLEAGIEHVTMEKRLSGQRF